MILFDLQCDKNHKFECWFASSTDYEEQLKNKMISCPYCNSTKIRKSLMAPNINTKSTAKNSKKNNLKGWQYLDSVSKKLYVTSFLMQFSDSKKHF